MIKSGVFGKRSEILIFENKSEGIAYCSQCGSAISDYFVIGEVVLVDSGVERPYYARINQVRNGDEGPYAIVFRSPNETAKVPLTNLKKMEVINA